MAVLTQNTCVWDFRLAAAMAIVIATVMAIAIGTGYCHGYYHGYNTVMAKEWC